MKTVHELLVSAPEEQVSRLKIVWKAVAEGRFDDAAFSLRNASNEAAGEWADEAAKLAGWLESKVAA